MRFSLRYAWHVLSGAETRANPTWGSGARRGVLLAAVTGYPPFLVFLVLWHLAGR